MKNIFLLLLFFNLVLTSCKQKEAVDEKKVVQILGDGKDYQDLIRNPMTADGLKDTSNLPQIKFDEIFYDFGDVVDGEVLEHTFRFKNIGQSALIISQANSSCGCTVPEYPKGAIAPNETDQIEVKFNTQGRSGEQTKTITVYSNAYPSKTEIKITANVIAKK